MQIGDRRKLKRKVRRKLAWETSRKLKLKIEVELRM
jgi:hypothetical protein